MRRSNENHYNEYSSENSSVHNSNQSLTRNNHYEPQNSRNVSYDHSEQNYHPSYSRKDAWKMRERQPQARDEIYSNHNNLKNGFGHRNQRNSYDNNPEYGNSVDWGKQNLMMRSNSSQPKYNSYENGNNSQLLTNNDSKETNFDRGNNFQSRENRFYQNKARENQNTEILRYSNRDRNLRSVRDGGSGGRGNQRDNRNFQRQLTSIKIFDLPDELFEILPLSKLVGKYGQVIKIIINPDRTSWIRFKSFQCARRSYKNLIDYQNKYNFGVQWPYLKIKERTQDLRRLKEEEDNNFGKKVEPKSTIYRVEKEIKDLAYDIEKSIKKFKHKYQKQIKPSSSSSSSRSSHSTKYSKKRKSYSQEKKKKVNIRSSKMKYDKFSSSEQDVEENKDMKKRRRKREEKKYRKRRNHNSSSSTEGKSERKDQNQKSKVKMNQSESESESENEKKNKTHNNYEEKDENENENEKKKYENESENENENEKDEVIDNDKEIQKNQDFENEMKTLYDIGINKYGILITDFKQPKAMTRENFLLKLQEKQNRLYLFAKKSEGKDQKEIISNASYSLQKLILKEMENTLNFFKLDQKQEMEKEKENEKEMEKEKEQENENEIETFKNSEIYPSKGNIINATWELDSNIHPKQIQDYLSTFGNIDQIIKSNENFLILKYTYPHDAKIAIQESKNCKFTNLQVKFEDQN
ncbi:calmodulin-binding protein-like protein [Anaeramoeba flamelloides]|uniref:Calmodulin-binding protein-like protein n=1 Tax=Anaeramoeba flamelloides TaxID=1746091 RepID=A0AAV7YTX9_9EUKA|nr:calmodulin-binding protein-like protein [Anaeramoeba flamelloides]